MKIKTSLLIVLFTYFYSLNAFSQEKLWEKDLREALYEVGWIKQANNGYIIAAGSKGLLALDNNTGNIVWHIKELKAIDKNSFQNVEGLPLFIVEYVPVIGKLRSIIVNAGTGEICFDTKEGDYNIKTYHIIPEKELILFELSSPGERNIMKFSLKTWQSEWVVNVGKTKGLYSKIRNAAGLAFIDQGPVFGPDNEVIVGIDEMTYGFDRESGKELWKYEADKKLKALVYSDINKSLYLGVKGDKKLTVLDPKSGNDITPGKLKLKGTLIDIMDDGKGNLVLVETEGFNLIEPNSGEFIWKSSYKIPYLDEVIPYEDGYIAIGKDEKDGSISLVSKDGKKIWDSKVRGYAYYATPTKQGVLYISTERSNILDYSNGKDVWDKDVKFRAIPAVTYDDKEDKVILYENGKGYKFDLETGQIDLFAEDIDLVDVTRKSPLIAEYVSSGYFITDDQHASVLSPEGKIVYTKYFKPVTGIGGLTEMAEVGLMFAGVDIDIDGEIENLKNLKQYAHGASATSRDQTDATSTSTVMAGLYVGTSSQNMVPVFEITQIRYSNSKNAKDHKFILCHEDEKNYIYLLNKASGEIEQKIELVDKTPDYVVDEIDNRVFLNEKNHLISVVQW